MRAVVYQSLGGPEVLKVVERETPVPEPHEVLVQLHLSGVNPTDWKSRSGTGKVVAYSEIVPNQDGAGIITAVGSEVSSKRVGERVWIYEACHGRSQGTAEEYIAIDEKNAVALRDKTSFELGASLGIPAITAHRCLTVGSLPSEHLEPGSLSGQTILVAGGAGAVGHFAIQLARWAGARVVTTVSNDAKGALAERAGADFIVNYRKSDAASQIRSFAPDGVDDIIEVSSVTNAALNAQVLKDGGSIVIYASGPEPLTIDIRSMMRINAALQFVYVYTIPKRAKRAAVKDINRALKAGVLSVGEDHGLPTIYFTLDRTAEAHRAVESGAIGKVLIDVMNRPA